MKLATFPRGGIHIPDNKLSSDEQIRVCPLPEEAVVFLSQHLGAPAQCCVQPKDRVKVGTVLGTANGLISAAVHSPVSGTVKKVEPRPDGAGFPRMAVVITVEGDEWEPESAASAAWAPGERPLSPPDWSPRAEEIIAAVTANGIVGMGGATFPTHAKLMIPPGKKADFLILDGVECEPFITGDHRLMQEFPGEVVRGAELLRIATGAREAIIGIEANKPEAIAAVRASVADFPQVSVRTLKVKYPQGAEKQLVRAITGREVPAGRLPIDVGAVVSNVATAQAVYLAVRFARPLIDRVVTVSGPAIEKPGNYLARIGTPIRNLIDLAGGLPADAGKVVLGGPMMGKACANLEVPLTKGTGSILVFPAALAKRAEPRPCIRCGRCVSVCPMGLEPYLLAQLSKMGRYDDAQARGILNCMECGSCSFTCPSHRDLVDWIRLGKAKILAARRKAAKA